MKKAYLLAFNDIAGKVAAVKDIVDKTPGVVTWRYDLPNAIYIISEETASQLSDKLHLSLPANSRFIITEIPDNSSGWLTPDSWYLIKNKVHRPPAPAAK
jgi:hypothetical protein